MIWMPGRCARCMAKVELALGGKPMECNGTLQYAPKVWVDARTSTPHRCPA